VIPEIGRLQLQKLRPLDSQALYGTIRKKGLSGTSALHIHRVLKEALKWAVR
jgi:hypothetical protein